MEEASSARRGAGALPPAPPDLLASMDLTKACHPRRTFHPAHTQNWPSLQPFWTQPWFRLASYPHGRRPNATWLVLHTKPKPIPCTELAVVYLIG